MKELPEYNQIQITVLDQEIRLDLVLQNELELQGFGKVSRSFVKEFLKSNPTYSSGRTLTSSSLLSKGRHTLDIRWNLLKELLENNKNSTLQSAPPSFKIPVVYEDEFLLILNKPSGIPSSPIKSEETLTASNFAITHFPHLSQVGKMNFEAGLLHRLDTGTSGLLAFAKTQSEFERLRLCWKERKIKKYYRSLVENHTLPMLPCTIQFPIGHDSHTSKRMIAILPEKEKALLRRIRGKPIPAVTHILKKDKTLMDDVIDLTLQIETGVMHQIRCHLSALGTPILGDTIYRGNPSDRLWLHAWRLEIPLLEGKTLALEAQLPISWPKYDASSF